MAVINFKSYSITKAVYSENKNFSQNENGKVHIQSKFDFEVIDNDSDSKTVVMWFKIEDNDNLPFNINVEINGEFDYNQDDDMDHGGFSNFRANALAILYPYLRNVVSQLTLMSNKFSSFILPTVNMYSVVRQHDKQDDVK